MKPVAMTPRIVEIYDGSKGPFDTPVELLHFIEALADPDLQPTEPHTDHDLQVLRWAHAKWQNTGRRPSIEERTAK